VSEHNSTAPTSADKPEKPTADYPLPRATKCWAKKIYGKRVCFGPRGKPTRRRRPLFAHASGRRQKIRGELHRFGRRREWQIALD
jgi:hypothetical protein